MKTNRISLVYLPFHQHKLRVDCGHVVLMEDILSAGGTRHAREVIPVEFLTETALLSVVLGLVDFKKLMAVIQ